MIPTSCGFNSSSSSQRVAFRPSSFLPVLELCILQKSLFFLVGILCFSFLACARAPLSGLFKKFGSVGEFIPFLACVYFCCYGLSSQNRYFLLCSGGVWFWLLLMSHASLLAWKSCFAGFFFFTADTSLVSLLYVFVYYTVLGLQSTG